MDPKSAGWKVSRAMFRLQTDLIYFSNLMAKSNDIRILQHGILQAYKEVKICAYYTKCVHVDMSATSKCGNVWI